MYYVQLPLTDRCYVGLPVVGSVCLDSGHLWGGGGPHLSLYNIYVILTCSGFTGPLVGTPVCLAVVYMLPALHRPFFTFFRVVGRGGWLPRLLF